MELQSEASECGLACIAMIAGHHRFGIGLRELRSRHALSLKGASLRHLIGVAGALGFQCRPLRLELEDLPRLKMPCILHWDLSHFVVLAKASKSRITIMDPGCGKRVLGIADASVHFTGVALELTPGEGFQRREPPPSVSARQLTGRIRGLWRSLGLVLLLSAVLQGFAVLAPFFTQWVVDQVLVSADRDLLTVLGLGFGLLLLLQVATGQLRGWAVIFLSNRLGLQWMGNVFAHLLKLPLEFFEKRHLGDVVSRMGSVPAIQKTLTTSFVEALVDGLMAMATLAMMLLEAGAGDACGLVALRCIACVVVPAPARRYRTPAGGCRPPADPLDGKHPRDAVGQGRVRRTAARIRLCQPDERNGQPRHLAGTGRAWVQRGQPAGVRGRAHRGGVDRCVARAAERVFRRHARGLPGVQGSVRGAHRLVDRQVDRVPDAPVARGATGGHRIDPARGRRREPSWPDGHRRWCAGSQGAVVPLCRRRAMGVAGLQFPGRTR